MSVRINPGHRRTPSFTVYLHDFSESEIADYLRDCGYYVSITSKAPHYEDGDPENVLDPDALDHIETLAVCGLMDAARSEALELIGNAIGRPLSM